MPKISYILVSRNDAYCGDSVARLQTALNHTGEILSKNNVLQDSEVILTDWGSPPENGPLRNALTLTDPIKKILKIVEVPQDIALKYQKDSPFSEVHAINVGFRRSSGEFFGRIDQDTLIGERYINWFHEDFHKKSLGFPWPLVAFSGRRNLNKDQSEDYHKYVFDGSSYKDVKISHPNNFYSRVSPQSKDMFLFYGGAVGILIVSRALYEAAKGFNEDFIYMNNMDAEFLNRLRTSTPFYNLGLRCDGDFYHLHHSQADSGAQDSPSSHSAGEGARKTNPVLIRREIIKNNNPDDWGLDSEELGVFSL
jgi:hypothetical protein